MLTRLIPRFALLILPALIALIGAAGMIGGAAQGNVIAYMVQGMRGVADLHLLDLDHAVSVPLTRTPAIHESYPAWSPDGHFLAYNAMDTVGQAACVIAPLAGELAPRCYSQRARFSQHMGWGADGRTLYLWDRDAFREISADVITGVETSINEGEGRVGFNAISADERYRIRQNMRELWLHDLVEARVIPLVQGEAVFSGLPVFSPDGMRVAFSAVMSGEPDIEIYLTDVYGSFLQQLTATDAAITDEAVTWSPDGVWIAFVTDRDWVNGSFSTSLYRMRADGSGVERLTFDPLLYSQPAWMP